MSALNNGDSAHANGEQCRPSDSANGDLSATLRPPPGLNPFPSQYPGFGSGIFNPLTNGTNIRVEGGATCSPVRTSSNNAPDGSRDQVFSVPATSSETAGQISELYARLQSLQTTSSHHGITNTATAEDLQRLQRAVDQFDRHLHNNVQTVGAFGGQLHAQGGQLCSLDGQVQANFKAHDSCLQGHGNQLQTHSGQLKAHDNQLQHLRLEVESLNSNISTITEFMVNLGQTHMTRQQAAQLEQSIVTVINTQSVLSARLEDIARLSAVEEAIRRIQLSTAGEAVFINPVHDRFDHVKAPRRINASNLNDTPNPHPTGNNPVVTPQSGHHQTPSRSSAHSKKGSQGPSPKGRTPAREPAAQFPVKSMGVIFEDLFTQVENWVRTFATMPLSALAHTDRHNSRLFSAAEEAATRMWVAKELLESPERHFLVCAIVNQILVTEILQSNIFDGYSTTEAQEYYEKYTAALELWKKCPMDSPRRGAYCFELAELADSITQQYGWWDFESTQVAIVAQFITEAVEVLIPAAHKVTAAGAIRPIVDQCFRIAARMAKERHEYDCRFFPHSERYDTRKMVVRGNETAQVSPHTHMVRLNMTPVVMEKTFTHVLMAEEVYRGQVLLTVKRGAQRGNRA
ncbi:hypothetical protein BDV97DRAFT_393632 [Delphinella strobiligena]|nr:hypothetical protein BDV97DRAFT_393632 [Delphinella strobiligena]